MIPAELELAQVAVQMLHADLTETAYDAALENAPIPINRAGVDIAAHPFVWGVVDYFVFLDVLRRALVKAAFIGIQVYIASALIEMLSLILSMM